MDDNNVRTRFSLVVWDSKTCVNRRLSKDRKLVFKTNYRLNAGQKYCRMLQGEHSAILLTFIKLPFVIQILVLSINEWPFYTGFTVLYCYAWIYFCNKIKLSISTTSKD